MSRRNIVKLNQLLTGDDLSDEMINDLIARAIAYKQGATYQFLEPKFVANLFYEESTKSHYSFEMAQHRLGLKILSFDPKSSSAYKGESMYDAGMTMSVLGIDLIVASSPQENYYKNWLTNPAFNSVVINAGDGDNEDPTYALTDLMTIYEKFGRFEGLTVGFVGSTQYSRVTKSTVKLLKRLGANVCFAGPSELQCQECVSFGQMMTINELVSSVDVLVVLRVQSERKDVKQEKTGYFEKYGITMERAKHCKEDMIILHPGPVKRNVEIADELVECHKSKILTQAQNAVFMNMAILEAILA